MKKIISLSLAAILALSVLVFAEKAQNDVMLIAESPEVAEPEKVTVNGVVSEVADDYIVIGENEYQFNIDENTYICDYDLNPIESLKKDDVISVIADSRTTRSIPPQAYAYYVFVNTENSQSYPIYATVDTNNGSEIMSKDGNNRIVFSEETPVLAHKIKIMLKAADITPNSEIVAFASVVGMSLPAHVAAEKIAVLSLADVSEKEVETGITIGDKTFEYADSSLFPEGSAPRLPLRAVCESLGYTVDWDDSDWSVYITGKERQTIKVQIGHEMFEGQSEENYPVIVDSRTYVTSELFDLLLIDFNK